MNRVVGDELAVVGGPELDADLAALLLLDEYALENGLEDPEWPTTAPSTPLLETSPSPPPSSPEDFEETKATPASPCSITDADDENMSQADHAQRRRRHRESMARYRQERRDRVDGMKDQETALQRILMNVLAHNKHIDNGSASVAPLQQYKAKFTELVRAREMLLLEKHELTGRLALHDQRARAFQSISEQVFSKSMFVFPRTPTGVWLRYEEDETPFYYEPIKEELCRKTIALGLKKMAELLRSLPKSQSPYPPGISTSNLMGWNAERAFTANEKHVPVMLFRFSRRVSSTLASMDDMHERAWKIYTSPEVMDQTSASSVRTKLVQQVHDDIVIMIRNAPEKKGTGRSRYLGLYHRMRTGDEQGTVSRNGRCAMAFTMLMNRAPREEEAGDLSGNWMKDGCALLRFTEKPTTPSNRDPGIDVEYMGYVECRDANHGDHMWAELCLLMLLWEKAVMPPQFLLS